MMFVKFTYAFQSIHCAINITVEVNQWSSSILFMSFILVLSHVILT